MYVSILSVVEGVHANRNILFWSNYFQASGFFAIIHFILPMLPIHLACSIIRQRTVSYSVTCNFLRSHRHQRAAYSLKGILPPIHFAVYLSWHNFVKFGIRLCPISPSHHVILACVHCSSHQIVVPKSLEAKVLMCLFCVNGDSLHFLESRSLISADVETLKSNVQFVFSKGFSWFAVRSKVTAQLLRRSEAASDSYIYCSPFSKLR